MRRLASELLAIDHVKYVYNRRDHIRVMYNTGFKRVYVHNPLRAYRYARPITRDQSACNWPIKIGYEHEWNPLDQDEQNRLSKYFHIPRTIIKTLSYIERELLVQHILGVLLEMGYTRPYWSEQAVCNELQKLRDTTDVYYRGELNFYTNSRYHPRAGRTLIEKHCDIHHAYRTKRAKPRTLARAFSNKKILFVALQHLIHDSVWDLNITTLHDILYKMKYSSPWRHPSVYRAVIEQSFDITNDTVLVDASPNMYEKAFSAYLLGCKYATIDGSIPPVALTNRIGVRVVEAIPPYDVLVFDNRFKPADIGRIHELHDISNNMLVYVRKGQLQEVKALLPPSKIIRLKSSPFSGRKPDFLFVYRTAKI